MYMYISVLMQGPYADLVPGTAGTEMKRALRFREETTAMHDAIKFCTLHAVRFVGSGRPSSDVFFDKSVERSYLLLM